MDTSTEYTACTSFTTGSLPTDKTTEQPTTLCAGDNLTWCILGGVISGLALLFLIGLIVLAVVLCKSKKKKDDTKTPPGNPEETVADTNLANGTAGIHLQPVQEDAGYYNTPYPAAASHLPTITNGAPGSPLPPRAIRSPQSPLPITTNGAPVYYSYLPRSPVPGRAPRPAGPQGVSNGGYYDYTPASPVPVRVPPPVMHQQQQGPVYDDVRDQRIAADRMQSLAHPGRPPLQPLAVHPTYLPIREVQPDYSPMQQPEYLPVQTQPEYVPMQTQPEYLPIEPQQEYLPLQPQQEYQPIATHGEYVGFHGRTQGLTRHAVPPPPPMAPPPPMSPPPQSPPPMAPAGGQRGLPRTDYNTGPGPRSPLPPVPYQGVTSDLPPPLPDKRHQQILQEQDALYEDTMVQEGVLLPPADQGNKAKAVPIYQRAPPPVAIGQRSPVTPIQAPRQPDLPNPRPAEKIYERGIALRGNAPAPPNDTYYQYPAREPAADYDVFPTRAVTRPAAPLESVPTSNRDPLLPLSPPVNPNHARVQSLDQSKSTTPRIKPTDNSHDGGGELYQDIGEYHTGTYYNGNNMREAGEAAPPPLPTSKPPPLKSPRPPSPPDAHPAVVETTANWPDDMYVDLPTESGSQNVYYDDTRPSTRTFTPPKRELTEEEKRQEKLKELIRRHGGQGQTPFSYFKN